MYNVLISIALSVATWLLFTAFGFSVAASLLPVLFVFPAAAFLLNRRTMQLVQAAVAPMQEMVAAMQQVTSIEQRDQKIEEIRALLISVRERFKQWQFLLEAQMNGQIGMLDYARLEFDKALPMLEQGSTWDWACQTALGCVRWRKEQYAGAKEAFVAAAKAAPKEPVAYAIPAILLLRKDERDQALAFLSRGLEQLPDHPVLRSMKTAAANKQAVPTSILGDGWYQFFPEDALRAQQQQHQEMLVRGRRGPVVVPEGVRWQAGPPAPKSRGKLARRR